MNLNCLLIQNVFLKKKIVPTFSRDGHEMSLHISLSVFCEAHHTVVHPGLAH